MADSTDFVIDKLRWAITSALVQAGNISDPTSGVKDTGHVVNAAPSSAEENNYRANLYAAVRWLVEDMLPGLEPWDGTLPGEPDLVVTDPVATYSIGAPAAKYWLGGRMYDLAAADVAYTSEATLTTRRDYLVVEVTGGTTAAYAVVEGTVEDTLPTLAANEYAVASYAVANGGAGSDPAEIVVVMYEPEQSRPQRGPVTIAVPGAGFTPDAITSQHTGTDAWGYTGGRIQLGRNGSEYTFAAPVDLPDGATIVSMFAVVRSWPSGSPPATAFGANLYREALNDGTPDFPSGGSNLIFTVSGSASTTTGENQRAEDTTPVANTDIVDKAQYAYSLRFTMTVPVSSPGEIFEFVGAGVIVDTSTITP